MDCPFGWPEPFVRAMSAHARLEAWPGRGANPDDYRRQLRFRETDRVIHSAGRPPLSVATDLISIVAMRFAGIADAVAEQGGTVDRSGAGVLAEVYPAAALRAWGLPDLRYKGSDQQASLSSLLDRLLELVPWLDFVGDVESQCRSNDDAFDSLIAAMVARAIQRGCTSWPQVGEQERLASLEGWIHVPWPGSTGQLLDRPGTSKRADLPTRAEAAAQIEVPEVRSPSVTALIGASAGHGCACAKYTGCTETTKSIFAPGHDAKLLSWLVEHGASAEQAREALTSDALFVKWFSMDANRAARGTTRYSR